jgi:hypothetical protein
MAKPPPILVEYEIQPEAWAAFLMTGASRMTIKIPEPKQPKPSLTNGSAHTAPLLLAGPKGQKKKLTGSAMTLAYLAAHKNRAVTNAELNKNVTDQGMNKNVVSVAMNGFLKKGYVERVGLGLYKILKEGIEHHKGKQHG